MDWHIHSHLDPQLDSTQRLDSILDALYRYRHLDDPQIRQDFLQDQPLDLANLPTLFPDLDFTQLKLATQIITKAIKTKQPIIIYGDYDVDGVCATAVLWETLNDLGANVLPFIPHRTDHGYGLSQKGLTAALKLFPDAKVKPLVITVDNGIRAQDAAQFLKEQGIDLVITDHHVAGSSLPSATALVHTTAVCGAGVSWILASQFSPTVDTSLVALATVCDQLPLTGPNRSLVRSGLRQLRTTNRPGLLALYSIAQIADPSLIDTYHLGFLLGPRINAAGRLGAAIDALRLLCTKNTAQAEKLAYQLHQQNQNRQELTLDFSQPALNYFHSLKVLPNLLFYPCPDCPEGILGLLASKLTETFNRPSVVLSTGQATAKGSARSLNHIDITSILSQSSAHLVDFGGHEMAAGLTVAADQIEDLGQALITHSAHLQPDDFQRLLHVEVEIDPADITPKLFNALSRLAPFGLGNPKPVFAATFPRYQLSVVGAQQNHLRLVLGDQGLTGIAFQLSSRLPQFSHQPPLQLAFTLEENHFRGRTSLQLVVKDLRPSSAH